MSNLLIRPSFNAFGVFLKNAENHAELLFKGSEEDCEKAARKNTNNKKEAVLYRTKDMRFLYIYESDNERYIEYSKGMVGYYIYDNNGDMVDGGEYEYFEEKTYLELAYIILSGENNEFSPIVKEYSFLEIAVPDENLFSSENDIERETPADTMYLV